jgi:ribonuclease HI
LANRDLGGQGDEFLDIVIVEIVIRKIPKREEERSALTVFGFRGFKRPTLDLRTHESVKSDLLSEKRGSHEGLLWVHIFQKENRRFSAKLFGPVVKKKSRVDVDLLTCGLRGCGRQRQDLGVYSIFFEEDNIPLEHIDLYYGMWHMHFDGSCSSEGNKACIMLYSLVGKIHNFSYRLEFACKNNLTEFKVLLLGILNAYNLGCGHFSIFGDFELVVNLICKIYSPSNKLMKRYTQTVCVLISNLLSFTITHANRELNSMDD